MSILVVLEAQAGGLKRTSCEAITAALSVSGGSAVTGIIFNGAQEQFAAAGAHGLSKVLNISGDEWTSIPSARMAAAISDAAVSVGASLVVFGANSFGKNVAPRVSVRLGAGFLPDCVALSGTAGSIEATRPVYAGKALVNVTSTTATTVVTLRPNLFTAKNVAGGEAASEPFSPTSASSLPTMRVTSVTRNEGQLDVSEADIIVSGGRGLKAPEHFNLIEGLAKSLGAAVGASRAVVDAGWRPHREQVGQTGKTVSPTMYVACGISGAVQHLAGMSSSKIIVAINKDKDAPIFSVADYGIVGDVFEVLPRLTSAISEVTGKN
jgi:electron transfer flavoprotein alpha subunit